MGGAPYIGPRLVGGPADIQGISIAVRVPGKLPMGSSYRIAEKFGGLAVNCNRQIKMAKISYSLWGSRTGPPNLNLLIFLQ